MMPDRVVIHEHHAGTDGYCRDEGSKLYVLLVDYVGAGRPGPRRWPADQMNRHYRARDGGRVLSLDLHLEIGRGRTHRQGGDAPDKHCRGPNIRAMHGHHRYHEKISKT